MDTRDPDRTPPGRSCNGLSLSTVIRLTVGAALAWSAAIYAQSPPVPDAAPMEPRGSTGFSHVDIDIPGNNALPVQLRRRFTVNALVPDQTHDARGGPGNTFGGVGNWDIEVPSWTTCPISRRWA